MLRNVPFILLRIFYTLKKFMCDMVCRESLSPPMVYTSPENEHDMVLSPVYSAPRAHTPMFLPQESKEDALDTFMAWMSLPPTHLRQHHYVSPHFNSEFTQWVDYVEMYVRSGGINPHVIQHTVSMFLRYINTPSVHKEHESQLPCQQWKDLVHERVACFWIALKIEDLEYEDMEKFTFVSCPHTLELAEMKVLAALEFMVSAPRDFSSIIGAALDIPQQVVHHSKDLLNSFLVHPGEWVGRPHALVCAGTIIAAWEIMGGDREKSTNSFSYVYKISELGVGSIPELYDMADVILGCVLQTF